MPAFTDLTGRVFGRLTVLGHTGRPGHPRITWRCSCACGGEVLVARTNLHNGHTRSCGCLNVEEIKKRRTTHGATAGHSATTTYNVWLGMKGRCSNPNNHIWKYYGGRGITLCERWNEFENFLADMGERPPGLSLERVDNNSGYYPDNCVWADKAAQSVNKRNTKFVIIRGEPRPFASLCEEYGVKYKTMWTRDQRASRPLTEADFELMKQRAHRKI